MRHGADPSDRYGGWSTYGLTEIGREQVHNAKSKLRNKGITKIYSSDLVRAKETAEIVANELSLKITYLPQFRESNNGLLAGMLKTEATKNILAYIGMHLNGHNRGLMVKVLSNFFVVFKEHGSNSKSK